MIAQSARMQPAVVTLVTAVLVISNGLSSHGDQMTSRLAARELPSLPSNLVVDPRLADLVQDMLVNSPTFAGQIRRLAQTLRLRVRLQLDAEAPRDWPLRDAECVMQRYEYGSIVAVVHLWSYQNAAALLAHELEHVLEYGEGLNYRLVARANPSAVWEIGGHFETRRAIDAGKLVGDEMMRPTAVARRR